MATRSLNKATIIGHVGKDAEVRYTGAGMPVATFTVATNESWKDRASGQVQERTDWHNIVVWNRLAEICGEYVKKGKRVYVEGRIQNRTYDDKDGNKRYVSEIVATDLILLDSPSGNNSHSSDGAPSYRSHAPAAAAGPATVAADFESAAAEDDLPF
jgi:single-strand DNA-binding protein